MEEKLINIYRDDDVNEPHYVIVTNKLVWKVLEHEINSYECDEFLEMVSNYIDEKEYEKSVMIKKHMKEIHFLKEEIEELKGSKK